MTTQPLDAYPDSFRRLDIARVLLERAADDLERVQGRIDDDSVRANVELARHLVRLATEELPA